MKKHLLLVLLLLMACPTLLLVLGIGNASIEGARAACVSTASAVPGTFRVGTLNWRGASHHITNPHHGERPFHERMPHMVAKIGGSAATIIGFQEFEPPQARAFLDATDGAWAIVPGRRHGRDSTADAIAYQPAIWTLDEVRHVSIRYGGPIIQVPLARFTSTNGVGSVWVLDTHHPADAIGGSDAMRDDAIRVESRTLSQLQDADPETPLLLTGDMNDRARFKQHFLSSTNGWSAANPTDEQIDWILGGPTVAFADTVVDHTTNDGAHRYTDHPFVHTRVALATSTVTPTTATTNAATTATTSVGDVTSASPVPTAGGHRDAVTRRSGASNTESDPIRQTCPGAATALLNELTADLKARIDAMLRTPTGLCDLSWTSGAPCTYDNQCPKVVDAVYGGHGVGRGLGNGEDVAQGIIDAGQARSHGTGLNPLPPLGAVVSYDTDDGVGHVAIYVGGGTIFGNDYGCTANGVYGCVGFADIRTPAGSVTWALPLPEFDHGGTPAAS